MPENSQPQQPEPEEDGAPVPNRRERRGGKSGAQTQFGGKSVRGRSGPAVNPRQYNTRRRGG
jgi:hypothetical protein